MKIAIIGSGITGLVAAYKLSKAGHEVTIFEQSKKIGGLAQCVDVQNTKIETTYHHFFRRDEHLITLLKELNIYKKMLWNKSTIATYFDGHLYPFNSPKDLLRFKPLHIVGKLRFGLVIMYLKHTTNWRKFSHVTAESWLNKYCGKNAYAVIWDPLLRGKFHEERHTISMSWMWGRINTRANSTKGKNSEEMLGYLEGSLDLLYTSLAEKLKLRKAIFHLHTTVTSITVRKTDNRVCVHTNDDKYTFDKVLCTVPSNVFAKLVESSDVPEDYIKKLLSIRYLSAACILFTSPQPLSNYYWHNINDNASPFVVFLQHTNLVGDEIYDHKNVYYMGGYFPNDHRFLTLPENEVLDEWFKHLRTIFPHFDMGLIENKYLFRFKNAQQVIDCDYENRIPSHKTPLKNVFLYNFSQIYPEGRGIDRAIREAYDATQMLNNETQ